MGEKKQELKEFKYIFSMFEGLAAQINSITRSQFIAENLQEMHERTQQWGDFFDKVVSPFIQHISLMFQATLVGPSLVAKKITDANFSLDELLAEAVIAKPP